MRQVFLAVVLALPCILLGAGVLASEQAVWFPDLGHYHRAIATEFPEAQKWFDQGFTLYLGFNHEEAIHSFQKAAEIDPTCAMAYWGIAISAGPNINNPEMDESMSKLAFESSRQALEMESSGVERDLIFNIRFRRIRLAFVPFMMSTEALCFEISSGCRSA